MGEAEIMDEAVALEAGRSFATLCAFLARFRRAAANEELFSAEAVEVGGEVEAAAEVGGGGDVGVGRLIDDRGDEARDVTLFVLAIMVLEMPEKRRPV